MNRMAFTLTEVTISLFIMGIAILGLGSTTARLTRVAVDAEARGLALQAVEDRLSRVRLHPIYEQLDSIYSESDEEIAGLPGYTRSTRLLRTLDEGSVPGKYVDYTKVTVTVTGPGLDAPVSGTVEIGAS